MASKDDSQSDLLKTLELAKAQILKQYGEGAIFFGDMVEKNIPSISTGNLKLDIALGIGGFPRGRIIEIYGAESLGKSLLAQSTVTQCQKSRGQAAYIDAECDFDPTWAKIIGVDVDSLIFSQPENGEQALEIVDILASTGVVDLIVVDSVAALTPKAEIEGHMDDVQVGAQARLMTKALRKLRHTLMSTNTTLIFINQLRDKIGFMQSGTTTPGGRALKFYSSVRIELRRIGDVKNSSTGELLGTNIKATVTKSKVARPLISCEYEILHGQGFNNEKSILELGSKYDLLKKKGIYYYKKDEEKPFGQGDRAACEYLKQNLEYTEELKQGIMNHAFRNSVTNDDK